MGKCFSHIIVVIGLIFVLVGSSCSKQPEETKNTEINPAPIHEVTITFLKSNPVQVNVHIQGGLPDGCTKFHDIKMTRDGDTINIEVTTEHPKDTSCPAIYGYFEKDVNLGSEFETGTTYTVEVNDVTETFTY